MSKSPTAKATVTIKTPYGDLSCLAVGPGDEYTVHASLVGTGFGTSKPILKADWDNPESREMHALAMAEEIKDAKESTLEWAKRENEGRRARR